ncbi:hypothetical protein [Burkholderia ubonensis]|uniref:hypothetical protein n=2 Tax=Burkholderia ubonensis TaxID=101571 RepID=UPI000AC146DD|nr:hypothetical protein [Burkholderia ubonensis]
MKLMRMRLMIVCLIGSFAVSCFADGTVDFREQVLPIINQRPFFANFLKKTFEFEGSAIGVTIGSNVSEKLGLVRIGPYRVCAKIRGDAQSGACEMQVVIDTNPHFYDEHGKEIDGPEGAWSVKEDFLGIEVDPPSN